MVDWDRQPGEPMLWYNRFEIYRLMGPDRSLLGAYKLYLHEKARKDAKKSPKTTPRPWNRNAEAWRWQARAEAWDIEVLRERAEQEEKEREEARRRRIEIARGLQGSGASVIRKGLSRDEIEAMAPEQAREHLRIANRMVMDGMSAERLELGLPTAHTDITSKGEKVLQSTPLTQEEVAMYEEAFRRGIAAMSSELGQQELERLPAEPIPESAGTETDSEPDGDEGGANGA